MNKRQAYPSDLTDEQWAILVPHIPLANACGRERAVDMRAILNGIFYLLVSGCSWRMLPHGFPNWETVYHYFRLWRTDGTWERLKRSLGEQVRTAAGRAASPSAGRIDSQSVKTSRRGWVGLGWWHEDQRAQTALNRGPVRAGPAGVCYGSQLTDREVAGWLIPWLPARVPRLQNRWADGLYQGLAFIQKLSEQCGILLEIIEREPGTTGCPLLPNRWVVARTLAWFSGYRRLSRHCQFWVTPSDAMIYAAMVHLMLRRLTPDR